MVWSLLKKVFFVLFLNKIKQCTYLSRLYLFRHGQGEQSGDNCLHYNTHSSLVAFLSRPPNRQETDVKQPHFLWDILRAFFLSNFSPKQNQRNTYCVWTLPQSSRGHSTAPSSWWSDSKNSCRVWLLRASLSKHDLLIFFLKTQIKTQGDLSELHLHKK